MYDIILKNGKIVDGTGKPGFFGDVAVKDGKIAKIAAQITDPATEVIDAKGLVVAPGFIDCHSHSDSSVFKGSNSYNYLEQGVTTQIAGACGSSPAPYYPGAMRTAQKKMSEEAFAERIRVTETPASFMEEAKSKNYGVNMAFFIGQSPIRAKHVGLFDVPATPEQIAAMQGTVRDAMEAGYLGFSTGLVYTPSVYASTEELIELAKAMAPYGGIYSSHIRGEGDYVERSVSEAIRIGEEAGVAVHISHLKVMGLHNVGKSAQLLKLMDDANARGVRVTADQYAYTASAAALGSQIPPKYRDGGIKMMLERIRDPKIRQQILRDILQRPDEFESGIYHGGFDGTLITKLPNTPQYVNRTIGEIAKTEGKEPIDVLCDILIANDGESSGVYFNQNPSDMIRIMGHPNVFCGSDSSDLTGERKDPMTEGGRHPRGMGNMIRRLELTRDFRLRSLEDSVRSVTAASAKAMHLDNQGLLEVGYDANITVFDYENLHAKANYEHPYRENEGIAYVLVNGQVALRHGKTTGIRAGKVLTRGK